MAQGSENKRQQVRMEVGIGHLMEGQAVLLWFMPGATRSPWTSRGSGVRWATRCSTYQSLREAQSQEACVVLTSLQRDENCLANGKMANSNSSLRIS